MISDIWKPVHRVNKEILDRKYHRWSIPLSIPGPARLIELLTGFLTEVCPPAGLS